MQGKASQVSRGLQTIAANIVANQDALAKYGIIVKDANGNLKSTYDVLAELKPKWDAMTDAERAALGQTLAGKNQFKVLSSVLTNFGTAVDAVKVAEEAHGSAMRENAKYMESYEAAISKLEGAFQNLSNAIISGDGLKGAINTLADFVQKISESEVAVFGIKTLLGTGAIWGAEELLKVSKILPTIVSQFKNFSTVVTWLPPLINKVGLSFAEASTVIQTETGVAVAGLSGYMLPIILAVVAAINLIAPAWEKAKEAREEAEYAASYAGITEASSDAKAQLRSYESEIKAIESSAEAATTKSKKRIQYLEGEIAGLRRELSALDAEAAKAYLSENNGADLKDDFSTTLANLFKTGNVAVYEKSAFHIDLENLREAKVSFDEAHKSEQEYIQDLQDFISVWGDRADALKSADESNKKYKLGLRSLTTEEKNLVEEVDNARKALKAFEPPLEDVQEGTENTTEVVDSLTESLKKLKEAADLGTAFDELQEGYQNFVQAYEKGTLGFEGRKTAVETYVPENILQDQFGGDIFKASEALFSGEGILRFNKRLMEAKNEVVEFGNILNEEIGKNGGKSISILKDGLPTVVAELRNGRYYFSSWKDIATYFGITEEAAKRLGESLKLASGQLLITDEEVENFAASLGIDLANAGVMGADKLAEVAIAIAKVQNTTDPDIIEEYINELIAAGKIKVAPEVDTKKVSEGVALAISKLGTIDDKTFQAVIEAVIDGDSLKEVEQLIANLIATKTVVIKTSTTDTSTGSTGGGYNVPGSGGKTIQSFDGNSTGTDNWKGGATLVNDGSPVNGSSAELIVQDGKAFIANGGEEAIINLERGAKVYNATETQKILKGGIQSFANGTVGGTGYVFPTGSGSYSGSGSGSSSSSSAKNVAQDTTDRIKEEFDQWVKEHRHMLAMDEITEEQYYKELEQMNERYLKGKKEYLDDYWQYQEEIYDYEKRKLEEQQASIEDIIELQEKMNELARVKEQKRLVYKEGRFQYVSDIEAIANAQREIDAMGISLGTSVAAVSGGVASSAIGSISGTVGNIGGFGQYGETINNYYNIDKITLENVNNVEELFAGIKNLALQSTGSRV